MPAEPCSIRDHVLDDTGDCATCRDEKFQKQWEEGKRQEEQDDLVRRGNGPFDLHDE
jgi:hypothetical protein